MRCHYIYDAEAGKVHIPGCIGSAVHGAYACTCYYKKEVIKDQRGQQIKDLEKENARLNRIIRNLLKQNSKQKLSK